jgi:hypothetical protein
VRTRVLVVAIVVALCATHAVFARSHRHAPKRTAPAAVTKTDTAPDKNRDPADVALDRRIKDICKGCWLWNCQPGTVRAIEMGPLKQEASQRS